MKNWFSLPGVLLGLAAGLLAGLLTSRLIGWFVTGLAIVMILVAVRLRRGKKRHEHVSGSVTSIGARG